MAQNKRQIGINQEETGCTRTFSRNITEFAELIIEPNIIAGTPTVECIGEPEIIDMLPEFDDNCTFNVSQDLCVEFDVSFGANASVGANGLVCDDPIIGGCGTPPMGCVLTRGRYQTDEEFTNSIIEAEGGSIPLGNGGNFSILATTGNVADIFDGNPPAPAPDIPQYETLYIQLLTAKLNVARGATCDFATEAIAAADAFLSNVTPADPTQASALADDLDDFNNGRINECPQKCD
ncbi:hypothetical protein EJF36_02070 [Bacillus sp. HMF5848]|uniref:hypothetical protein n=1 Tax=Bacillus sp. HMF5848 TaxID=2495421 RepID=UPI000F7AF245|nr:hypothetical protein [Bacillus sp. HMF5848]RSK25776.1 hypothetical protein EJF36_02070 [Bacillus sp. HMF5848]